MSCFRIDLSTYVDLNEAKLEAWANKFFVHHTSKKPLLFGEVSETDYKVKQLQSLVTHNLKNWKARSTKRYRMQWIGQISPWDFAQECPAKKILVAHKLQRLAAILSPETIGMRALKKNAEPGLAKKAYEQAQEKWKNFAEGEMDAHRTAWGYNGDPEGWNLLKDREYELKEIFESAKRCRACEEETLEKKQRV